MKIAFSQAFATVIHQGDYFVIETTPSGNHVHYSPDGETNALAIGAVAALAGHIIHLGMEDIQKRIETLGDYAAVEDELIGEIEAMAVLGKPKPMRQNQGAAMEVVRVLGRRARDMEAGREWNGTTTELLRYLGLEDTFSPEVRRNIPGAVKGMGLGGIIFTRREDSPGYRVSISWDKLWESIKGRYQADTV